MKVAGNRTCISTLRFSFFFSIDGEVGANSFVKSESNNKRFSKF